MSASDWADLKEQRFVWGGSGLTSIASSVPPLLSAKRIARGLAADPSFNVVDLSDLHGAGGGSWADARANGGPATFRAESVTLVELCKIVGDPGAAVWDRLAPTGEYAALLIDRNLAGGIVMRLNKKHGAWEYEVDQGVNSWAFIDAVAAASREATSFDVRFARTTLLSWAVFRFPSGIVKAAWLAPGRPILPSIGGKRLSAGVLYPQDYVLAPVQFGDFGPSMLGP